MRGTSNDEGDIIIGGGDGAVICCGVEVVSDSDRM